MITDNTQLHEYIVELLTEHSHMSAYSILVRILSYADDNNISLPDMIQPENSEIALEEISEVINELIS